VRAIVKFVIAIVVILIAVVVVIGPGRVVAGTEYPFGVGPWSSTGRYCRDIYTMTHFVDEWKHSGRATSSSQKQMWLAFEKTLTQTGPVVPRADFTAFYRRTGNVGKRMKGESALINTWWDQNCTNLLMEAPASASHVWSGVDSRDTFVHFPKNVIHIENFFKVIG
jgi:hypothetical protein